MKAVRPRERASDQSGRSLSICACLQYNTWTLAIDFCNCLLRAMCKIFFPFPAAKKILSHEDRSSIRSIARTESRASKRHLCNCTRTRDSSIGKNRHGFSLIVRATPTTSTRERRLNFIRFRSSRFANTSPWTIRILEIYGIHTQSDYCPRKRR